MKSSFGWPLASSLSFLGPGWQFDRQGVLLGHMLLVVMSLCRVLLIFVVIFKDL